MSTSAKAFWGTLLKLGANTVAEVRNLKAGGIRSLNVNVTSQDSTSGFSEFISAGKEVAEITFSANLIKSQLNTLFGVVGTVSSWSIVFSDGATFAGSGIISLEIDEGSQNTSALSYSGTIQPTGVWTYTPGA